MAKAGYLALMPNAWTINAPSSSVNISSTTFTTPTLTVNVAAAPTPAIAVGQRVYITGQTAATGNNGDWVVLAVNTTTQFTLTNAAGVANATAQGTTVFTTPQTILAVTAPAQFGIDVKRVELSFTASAATGPYLVELLNHGTLTGGTSVTNPASAINQVYGPSIATGFTVAGPYTAEPSSTPTILESWLVTPNQTTMIYDLPLGTSYDGAASSTMALRITPFATSTSSLVRASMLVERC